MELGKWSTSKGKRLRVEVRGVEVIVEAPRPLHWTLIHLDTHTSGHTPGGVLHPSNYNPLGIDSLRRWKIINSGSAPVDSSRKYTHTSPYNLNPRDFVINMEAFRSLVEEIWSMGWFLLSLHVPEHLDSTSPHEAHPQSKR
jgi:hypothetical protein